MNSKVLHLLSLSSADKGPHPLLKPSFAAFPLWTNLHPVVELFGSIAWTRHRVLRFAHRIEGETFLHSGLLAVQLIGNVGQESSSFDAETKK